MRFGFVPDQVLCPRIGMALIWKKIRWIPGETLMNICRRESIGRILIFIPKGETQPFPRMTSPTGNNEASVFFCPLLSTAVMLGPFGKSSGDEFCRSHGDAGHLVFGICKFAECLSHFYRPHESLNEPSVRAAGFG